MPVVAKSLIRFRWPTLKMISRGRSTGSLALDDPRSDHDHAHHPWGRPVDFLPLLRAPEAFEHHGYMAELAQLPGDDEPTVVHPDGAPWLTLPRGWRVVPLEPDNRADPAGMRVTVRRTPGYVAPRSWCQEPRGPRQPRPCLDRCRVARRR